MAGLQPPVATRIKFLDVASTGGTDDENGYRAKNYGTKAALISFGRWRNCWSKAAFPFPKTDPVCAALKEINVLERQVEDDQKR